MSHNYYSRTSGGRDSSREISHGTSHRDVNTRNFEHDIDKYGNRNHRYRSIQSGDEGSARCGSGSGSCSGSGSGSSSSSGRGHQRDDYKISDNDRDKSGSNGWSRKSGSSSSSSGRYYGPASEKMDYCDDEQRRHKRRSSGDRLAFDWICDKCAYINFARRRDCKQCNEQYSDRCQHASEIEEHACSHIHRSAYSSGAGTVSNNENKSMLKDSGVSGASVSRMATAALQAAQWSSNNSYSRGWSDSCSVEQSSSSGGQSQMSVPKPSKYPPLFEIEGSKYIFQPASGCFQHMLSTYYYMPKAKLYYNSANACYYRYCAPISSPPLIQFICQPDVYSSMEPYYFQEMAPPQPPQQPLATTISPTTPTEGASARGNSAPPVSVEVVAPKKVFKMSLNSLKSLKTTPRVVLAPTNASIIPAEVGTEEEVVELPQDQMQSADPLDQTPDVSSASVSIHTTSAVNLAYPQTTPTPIPPAHVCLLCQRKFNSAEMLQRHYNVSELHKENLMKRELAQQQEEEEDVQVGLSLGKGDVSPDGEQNMGENEVTASFHRTMNRIKYQKFHSAHTAAATGTGTGTDTATAGTGSTGSSTIN